MRKRVTASVVLCLWAVIAQAQLQKATTEELGARAGGGGGTRAGGMPGTQTVPARPPSTDPRDFSGTWRQLRQPVSGARSAGAGLPSAPTGVADPNINPEGNRSVGGRLPDRVLCLPQSDPTYVGVDGPTQITQTPDTIVWAPEEMHHIRRIYLTGGPTPDLKPSYLGEALGRWEGDTLVVETRGLRSLPAGAKLVERWQKNAEGNELAIDYGPVDARGAPLRAVRTLKLNWASGQQVLEWICEDYSDEWLPGGGEYRDQTSTTLTDTAAAAARGAPAAGATPRAP